MIHRTIFAGFGGQGVMLMGYVLAHAAMLKGLNLTYLPAYGVEMRGGTANCTVTVADEEIASPVASELDCLAALNLPSLERFAPLVKPGGLILINASLIPENQRPRSEAVLVRVPTHELALEVGSARAANMVMLGVFIGKTGLLTLAETFAGLKAALAGKEQLLEINLAGIEKGAEFAAETSGG
ncbi:MAG: 2-oxoacid:acceptor oxidoreductase family protein [Thermodesulfobacteriota bacterium]